MVNLIRPRFAVAAIDEQREHAGDVRGGELASAVK